MTAGKKVAAKRQSVRRDAAKKKPSLTDISLMRLAQDGKGPPTLMAIMAGCLQRIATAAESTVAAAAAMAAATADNARCTRRIMEVVDYDKAFRGPSNADLAKLQQINAELTKLQKNWPFPKSTQGDTHG